jgi:hypothetical protein
MATSAFAQVAPNSFYQEQPAPAKQSAMAYFSYDLDFTKTSINPAINYYTAPNPRAPGNIVKFRPHTFVAAIGAGACFEISSSGPAGSDLILSVANQAGNYVWVADDNAGGGQFRARMYLPASAQYTVRISEYFSPNNNNQNAIGIIKVNADPGSAITASSCRTAGMPYWQPNLNAGNPYNPS